MVYDNNQAQKLVLEASRLNRSNLAFIDNALKQASNLYKKAQYNGVVKLCLDVLALDSKNFYANKFAGAAFLKLYKWDSALHFFKNNISYHPTNIDCYLDLSLCLLENTYGKRKYFLLAVDIINDGLKLDVNNHNLLLRLFTIYQKLGQFDKSKECLDKALELKPNDANVRFELANHYKDTGDFSSAINLYRELLADNPKHVTAIYNLFFIKKFKEIDSELLMAEKLLMDRSVSEYHRQCLLFALFKAYDDLGHFDKAFSYLQDGNAIAKSLSSSKFKNDIVIMESFTKIFNQKYIDTRAAEVKYDYSKYPTPIFVVSMPRSGSTLVEKILSSHSQVESAGEPFYLKQVFGDMQCRFDTEDPLLISSEGLIEKATQYLELLSQHANKDTQYVVDKLPLNFVFIGLIKIIFPHAKIIYLDRDPVAVGFSCYKHMFSDGQCFSFDLEDIVQYYKSHKKMKMHWHTHLDKNSFYDLNYIDLVEKPKETMKNILDYCGLEWQNTCEKFYEVDAKVQSASLVQVRKPIYKGSNENWKNYEKHLGVFVKKLKGL